MNPRKVAMRLASALLVAFAAAPAHAGAGAVCSAASGMIGHTGADGSHCFGSSDGTDTAISKASVDGLAQTFVITAGEANAAATDHSGAVSQAGKGGLATSNAKDHSEAEAFGYAGGVAKATADDQSSVQAQSSVGCNATAKATGASSIAIAQCSNGGFAHVTATNGGVAQGADSAKPTCTPNGGTSKVRSTGGNCG
jgi:hypothetical protein